MILQFEPLRQEIRDTAIIKKDYKRAIEKCYEYLYLVETLDSTIYKDEDLRFIYYEIALDNKKIGNYEVAIEHNKIALSYIEKDEMKVDYRYINSVWLMAECYNILGNMKEAIKNYDLCSKLYRTVEEKNLRICTLWNKAKITRNSRVMLRLIKIYETRNFQTVVTTYGDMEYDSILSQMYRDLFQLYSTKFDIKSAIKLFLMCRSKTLRNEFSEILS